MREHSDGIAALENGSADAYASDRVILIGLALASKNPTKLWRWPSSIYHTNRMA